MHNILIFTIEHCVKVRTDGGKDQSVRRNNDHSRFQLDITQLAINSHSIHGWESINRMALERISCYNPSYLYCLWPCACGVAESGGLQGCRGCPRSPWRRRWPTRSDSAGTFPGCWHLKLCHYLVSHKISIIQTSHIHCVYLWESDMMSSAPVDTLTPPLTWWPLTTAPDGCPRHTDTSLCLHPRLLSSCPLTTGTVQSRAGWGQTRTHRLQTQGGTNRRQK